MANEMKIYLASGSPRRKELLEAADIPFSRIHIDVEEIYPKGLPADEVAEYLAKLKAEAALAKVDTGLVITADTVVIRDGQILEKPGDREHAFEMIRNLADGVHEVITGVCLYTRQIRASFSTVTKVWLMPMSDAEIFYYIDNYHPFDKAGAYGIQEWIGWVKINRIEGSFANVMGLPVSEVYQKLIEKFGYQPGGIGTES